MITVKTERNTPEKKGGASKRKKKRRKVKLYQD